MATVTLLGTGTSTGVPVLTCECSVCTSTNPKNRRTRTSALIQAGPRAILIDCGADFREQALAAKLKRLDAVLLTHGHADHTAGLDDLRMYNIKQKVPMPLHGNAETLDDVRVRFDYCFRTGVQEGGGLPQFDMVYVEQPFELCRMRIVPIPVFHGRLPILGYRVGDFAYITDANKIPDASFALLEGVKTLVLNALRHRPHSTHFSVGEALDVSARIGADLTLFTHMTHDLDHDDTNRDLPARARLAYDGESFEISGTEWEYE